MNFNITNIKSFDGNRSFEIAPITLITGENSSGKTAFIQTFAAAFRTLWNNDLNAIDPYFNSFEDVASYKGGRFGRAQKFGFGFQIEIGKRMATVRTEHVDNKGVSNISFMLIETDISEFRVDYKKMKAHLRYEGDEVEYDLNQFKGYFNLGRFSLIDPIRTIFMIDFKNIKKPRHELVEHFSSILYNPQMRQLTEFAPIRAKPQKYYDGISVQDDAIGSHAPYILREAFDKGEKNKDFTETIKLLNAFGKKSGLFDRIGPRQLGKSITDPFQICVSNSGPQTNISNVGYGVNQSLPIIAHIFFKIQRNEQLVIQQPEVHLHPRAQAELGTLFSSFNKSLGAKFLIETHSDYLIDRIRMCARDGLINHADVKIYHFTKKKASTSFDKLSIDQYGNIIDPPKSYRSFFLKEQLNLLSVK